MRIEVHRLFCYGGHFEYKMASKIQKSSDLDEMWFPSRLSCCELISIVGLLWWPFWIQNGRQNKKILRFGRNLISKYIMMLRIDMNRWFAMVAILSMVSDFNENWYLGVVWSEELVGALNSDMGVVWGLLCLHPNTSKPTQQTRNVSVTLK